MSGMVRLAVVGAGAMGTQHARVIDASDRAGVAVVIDDDPSRAEHLAALTGARVGTDLDAALGCDGAIVATSTDTHLDVALPLLGAEVPLLIEKPIDADLEGVQAVLEASGSRGIPVTCGFVERFNPAVTTALSLLRDAPYHVTAMRHSPHTPRATASVVWDLLVHDIDLAIRCAPERRVADVRSATWAPKAGVVPEIADCTIRFDDGMLATLSSSRAGQRKIRTFSMAGADTLVEVDLLRADVTVYRHVRQEQITEGETTYRAETIVDIPFVRHAGEPLALQLEHFLDLIDGTADADAERATLRAPHEVAASVAEGQM